MCTDMCPSTGRESPRATVCIAGGSLHLPPDLVRECAGHERAGRRSIGLVRSCHQSAMDLAGQICAEILKGSSAGEAAVSAQPGLLGLVAVAGLARIAIPPNFWAFRGPPPPPLPLLTSTPPLGVARSCTAGEILEWMRAFGNYVSLIDQPPIITWSIDALWLFRGGPPVRCSTSVQRLPREHLPPSDVKSC